MTLDEFMRDAEIRLGAFADAYRREALTDPTFYPDRDEADWWREVAAYTQIVDLQDSLGRKGLWPPSRA